MWVEFINRTKAHQRLFPKPAMKLFKRSGAEKRFYLLMADFVSFTLCVFLGYLISCDIKTIFFPELMQIEGSNAIKAYPLFFGLPMVLIMVMSERYGHYSRFKGFWEEYQEFIRSVFIAAGLTAAYLFLIKSHFSRSWLVITWGLVLFIVPLFRVCCKTWMMYEGKWFTPTIVIGSGENALKSALAIESNTLMGFRVLALMDLDPESNQKHKKIRNFLTGKEHTYPVMPFSEESLQKLGSLGVPYVVLALESGEYIRYQPFLEQLAASRHNMSVIPPLSGIPLLGSEISPIFRHEVLHIRIKNNLARRGPRFLKRMFDIAASGMLIVLLSPVFLFLALEIRRDGGSAFYLQERIGKDRRPFNCIKFRSMWMDADKRLHDLLESDEVLRKQWQKDRKLKNDPRITEIGHFLRKSSLDELPQLFNVFKGEMSLVGPRPIVEEELKEYGSQVSFYLDTRPGLTGLWQISGRNDVDYSARVNLDVWYVRNWSLWYDITILFKTIGVVCRKNGAY